MTITSKGRLLAAGGAVVLASLAAACGGTSGSGTRSASPVPSVPTAPAQVTGTGDAQRFQQVATGPLARAVRDDAVQLTRDAANPNAAEADARKLASDLAVWSSALRSVLVPAGSQAIKDKLLQGLNRMRKGVTELADGLRSHDDALVRQGQADIEAGVGIISQAAGATP